MCDAILVGINTILTDNPSLLPKTVDFKKRTRKYYRIVLASDYKIPAGMKILKTTNKIRTIIAVTDIKAKSIRTINGCEILKIPSDKNGFVNLHILLAKLRKKGIRKILVEGGGTVIWSFLSKKLVDEIWLYIGSMIIGGRKTPTFADGTGATLPSEIVPIQLKSVRKFSKGVLLHFKTI
jgi:2,5-diamino-6-(ribosylamino)-4(3H)-pyrimidinone 5'-phosphate reductase